MHQGQEKFFEFIIERVQEEHKENTRNLLDDTFVKQVQGSFQQGNILNFQTQILKFLKEEYREEVSGIIKDNKRPMYHRSEPYSIN